MMKAILIILAINLIGAYSDPIVVAKHHIVQKKFDLALNILEQSNDVERHYFIGWCHYKMGHCTESISALNRFIELQEGPEIGGWVNEAQRLIYKCGSQATVRVSKSNDSDIAKSKGSKYAKEDYINRLIASQDDDLEDLAVEESKPSKSIRFIIPRERFEDVIYKKTDNQLGFVDDQNTKDKGLSADPSSDDMDDVDLVIEDLPEEKPQSKNKKDGILKDTELEDAFRSGQESPIDIPGRDDHSTLNVDDNKKHFKILFSVEKEKDKSFISISDFGPVICVEARNGYYNYYVGHYTHEQEASVVQKRIKNSGYKMAKVIKFEGRKLAKYQTDDSRKMVGKIKEVENQIIKELGEVKPTIQEVKKQNMISYHILFRVLDNPFEDFPELRDVGPLYIERYDTKGNCRYLVGNTDDLKKAGKLLKKVKKAGYPSSFIVEYINGELKGLVK